MLHIFSQKRILADAFIVGDKDDLLALAEALKKAAETGLGIASNQKAGNGTPFDVCVVRDEKGDACQHKLSPPWPGESKTASGDKIVPEEQFWKLKGGEALEQSAEKEVVLVPDITRHLAILEEVSKDSRSLPKETRRKISLELENLRTGKTYDIAFVEGLKK